MTLLLIKEVLFKGKRMCRITGKLKSYGYSPYTENKHEDKRW